jgi:hypothetical protein
MAFPLAAVGAVTGGINALSGLFGKKSGGSAAAAPIDYYEQYGAQAAAASSPLTAATEALGLVGASLDQQKVLGQAKLATELTAPQFTSKAAEGALSGENAFAQLLGQTNTGLKALQESTKADVAADQAKALGDVFRTRASAEGQLALGAQKLESGLTLQRGQTLSNLQQIQGQTQAQMALRRQGNQLAMAGQRYFA